MARSAVPLSSRGGKKSQVAVMRMKLMVRGVETYMGTRKLVVRRRAPSVMAAAPLSTKKNVTSQVGFLLVILWKISSCISPETRKQENIDAERTHSGNREAYLLVPAQAPEHQE